MWPYCFVPTDLIMTFEQPYLARPLFFVSFGSMLPSSMSFLIIASALSTFPPRLPCLCLLNGVTVTLVSTSDTSFSPWLWGGGQSCWLYHSCTMPGDSSTDRPPNVQIPHWKEDCISVNKAPEHGCGFAVLSRSAEGCAGQRIMGRIWPPFLSQFLCTCWVYITLYWRGAGAAHQRIFWVSEVN